MEESALGSALKDNRIRAAAIDVHEHEPYNIFSGKRAQRALSSDKRAQRALRLKKIKKPVQRIIFSSKFMMI